MRISSNVQKKVYVILSFIMLIVDSCKTPEEPIVSLGKMQLTVEEAFQYYKSVKGASVEYMGDDVEFPLWSQTTQISTTDSLGKPKHLLVVPLFNSSLLSGPRQFERVLFSRKDDGDIESLIVSVQADITYLKTKNNNISLRDLSGIVTLRQLGEDIFLGYKYERGKPVRTLTNFVRLDDQNKSKLRKHSCSYRLVTSGCIDYYYYTIAYGKTSPPTYSYTACGYAGFVFACDLPEQLVHMYFASSGTYVPSGQSVADPGVVVANGARPCVGAIVRGLLDQVGAGSHATATVNVSRAFMPSPCSSDGFFMSLYGPNPKYRVVFEEQSISNRTVDGQSQVVNASTYPEWRYGIVAPAGSPQIIHIRLNPAYLNTATDLSVARTIVHELFHAYFEVFKRECSGDLTLAEANKILFNPDPNINENSNQHKLMADVYADRMTQMIGIWALATNTPIPVAINGKSEPYYLQYLVFGTLTLADRNNQIIDQVLQMRGRDQRRAIDVKNSENNNTSGSSGKKGC